MQSPSTLALRPGSKSPTESGNSSRVLLAFIKYFSILALVALVGIAIQSPIGFRTIAACSIFLLLIISLWKFPEIGVVSTLAFLAIQGGVRRWLIPDFGWLGYDPLILVGPAITFVFFLSIAMRRKVPASTALTRCLKFLLILMAIQVLNPLQGSLLVGLGGALYYIGPLLWFYIGRIRGDSQSALLLCKAAIVIFTITAIYGLKQVFFGISASEKSWVDMSGYTALAISDTTIRVFSTFASTQEYAATLASAIAICAAFILQRKTMYVLPLFILVPALVYTGTRGPVVSALFAICVQWALLGKNRNIWLPRLGLGIFLGAVGLVWSLGNVQTASLNQAQREILAHQQQGLLNPTESTAPGHVLAIYNGVISGITHPLGIGLGATTQSASKLGLEGAYSSEVDLSNLFMSLGLIGGVLYCVILFLVFKEILVVWNHSRNIVFLIGIGLLTVNFTQWLNGGLYSLCFLVWFFIGFIDKQYFALNATNDPRKEKAGTSGGRNLLRGRISRAPRRNLRNASRRGMQRRPVRSASQRLLRNQP
jgi:hypothetical protein